MIRTIWLGFTFLIILAGAGSFRLAFGHFDTANASDIATSEHSRTISPKAVQDTLTKADQLVVAHVSSAPDATELAKAAYIAVESSHRTTAAEVTPDDVVEPAPDVVEQRAQEPAPPVARPAPLVVRKAKIEKPRRKQPKPDAVANKPLPAADPKICQVEEFEAFRYAFSLPTGCHG